MQIDAATVGWNNLTVYKINAKYEKDNFLFEQFVLENLNKFIEGSTK